MRVAVGFGIALALLVGGVAACSSDDAAAAGENAGPPNPDGLKQGSSCKQNSECQSLACNDGKCTAVVPGGNPADKTRNGAETDVDCGGEGAPKCADGRTCKVGDDCVSGTCTDTKCASPAPDDGVKNGDESDVDCGGTKAPKCASGKTCAADDDCASDACSYANKCVESKSCTGHFGGDTCGAGETGEAGAKHESCCTTVKGAGGTTLDKYYVTAGRMRAFVEKYKGNLQSWVATAKPKGWNASWTQELPASMDDALVALGPNGKRGCFVSGDGGRTYSQPPVGGDKDEVSDYSKDVLDEKILNCVSWHMAQAICHYGGGRLVKSNEVIAQVTNGGTTSFPWGNSPTFTKGKSMDQIAHAYSYYTPNPPANLRLVNGDYPLDKATHIPPPGRHPLGANKSGVQDAMGAIIPWVGDGYNKILTTASWENHGYSKTVASWPPSSSSDPNGEREGYYAIGVRCAYDAP